MKYRKKPVVIEAINVGDAHVGKLPEWLETAHKNKIIKFLVNGIEIKTLEGTMHANMDDMLIQGVNGEIYPCKPDIFEKTYEEVKE